MKCIKTYNWGNKTLVSTYAILCLSKRLSYFQCDMLRGFVE